MPWIESHDNLEQHPKLLALANAMGWNNYETGGRLHAFWKWCLQYAPTGDLHNFDEVVLASAAGVAVSEAKRFITAMTDRQSRWIDRGRGADGSSVFRVHDWPDYTRKYLKESKFRDKPEKWRELLRVYQVRLQNDSGITPEVSAVPDLPDQPNECVTQAPVREDSPTAKDVVRLAMMAHEAFPLTPPHTPDQIVLANVRELLAKGRDPADVERLCAWCRASKHPRKPKSPQTLTDPTKWEQWHTMKQEEKEGSASGVNQTSGRNRGTYAEKHPQDYTKAKGFVRAGTRK